MSKLLFSEEFLRKLERLSILSRRRMAGQMPGERRSSKRGQSVEFADFKPYTSGDDIRRIDWNAYARLERFFIKLFIEEEDLTIHILIDTSQSMHWGNPEKLAYAVRAAGAIGYIGLTGLDQVTITALGGNPPAHNQTMSPMRGKQQALLLFSFLQSIMDKNPDLAAGAVAHMAIEYSGVSKSPGPLLLLSDLMEDGWQQPLNNLARRGFDITILHILSPDENRPELSGELKLIDSENKRAVEITADFETLDRYQQGLTSWREEWHRFCAQRNMHYIPLETSLPLEELLFSWLREQRVLK